MHRYTPQRQRKQAGKIAQVLAICRRIACNGLSDSVGPFPLRRGPNQEQAKRLLPRMRI